MRLGAPARGRDAGGRTLPPRRGLSRAGGNRAHRGARNDPVHRGAPRGAKLRLTDMVVFYALGGGLGHLTRARRVVAQLGLDSDAVLLTASRHASDPRVTGGLEVVEVPQRLADDRSGFRRWVAAALREVQASELFVDTFPGGILGELCGLELPPAQLVSRRLRWPAYRHRLAGPLPAYEVARVIEPLCSAHIDVLSAIAGRVEPLTLSVQRPPAGAPLFEEPHVVV